MTASAGAPTAIRAQTGVGRPIVVAAKMDDVEAAALAQAALRSRSQHSGTPTAKPSSPMGANTHTSSSRCDSASRRLSRPLAAGKREPMGIGALAPIDGGARYDDAMHEESLTKSFRPVGRARGAEGRRRRPAKVLRRHPHPSA
jgi:hypothetical protein